MKCCCAVLPQQQLCTALCTAHRSINDPDIHYIIKTLHSLPEPLPEALPDVECKRRREVNVYCQRLPVFCYLDLNKQQAVELMVLS